MQESDSHLLTRFATHRDEAAFGELANRHLGLIYHVALRRTGDRQLAEEVSQNVLCAVVRKAAGLAKHPDRLPAWLHRATLFESSKAMRSEASHQRRKQLVHPDGIAITSDTEAWNAALPHLDLALDRLSDADRGIVLRHYFEGKSFSQIGGEVSRPAATVQKQCRRAIDKLARILRGKGVALSVTALAAGLSTQTAKAAPLVLTKSIAAKALAGAASHSTTSLTLFMAMKYKAALPLCLLLLATPLALQQIAISRAASRNENLRPALANVEAQTRISSRSAETRTVSTGNKRITIDVLQRAMKEADRSALKGIEFEQMLAALDARILEILIPQTFTLPDPRNERVNLLRHLVGALAKTDPGLAVRLACEADPKQPIIPNAGIEQAIFRWATADPDEAIEWLRELHGKPSGSNWHAFLQYQAAVAAPLILSGSPRVREVLTLSPDVYPEYVLRDAMGQLDEGKPKGDASDFTVEAFSRFLPWIREIVPEERSGKGGGSQMDRREAFERLLFETGSWNSPMENPVPGKILETLDLQPFEQRIIAEYQTQCILATPVNTRPRPDRAKVAAAARNWLQAHLPEEAEEIFEKSKSILTDRERRGIELSLQDLAARDAVRDSDILQELGQLDFAEFPEFRPQALEQARKIKDPAKRAETIRLLETTGNSSPADP
jgi:RNA polymerase sigma-70 factor (ECF subfamily)